MNIKLFPDNAEGALNAKPKANSVPIKTESGREKSVPADIAAKTFSVETANDGVIQLPSLDPSEGGPPDIKEKKPEKQVEEVKDKSGEEIEEKVKEEIKEESEESKGIERFLKPPKGSQAEKEANTKKGLQFDFSGFDAGEQEILKKMTKENVPAVMKLMKDAKEYNNAQKNQFFAHPEGYLLHPGYKQEIATVQRAEAEGRIWSGLLKSVKNGESIKPITGWTNDGRPVFGNEVKVTAENSTELEEEIRNMMNQCMAVASEKRRNVEQFVKNFPQIANKDFETIEAERAKRFVWVANPKLQDHTITMEDGIDRSIKQIRNDVISLFPAYMRNTKPAEVCGDLMVALILAKQEIAEHKKNGKVSSIKREEENQIEPTGGGPKPKKIREAGPGGIKTFSLDGAGVEIHGA